MKIRKTYKFKLRPTKAQISTFNEWLGTCRFLYNVAKETREWAYNSYGISLNYYALSKQLTACKQLEGFEWLKNVSAQTLQEVLERQEKAYQTFFKGGGYPKWAQKDKYNSFTIKAIKTDTHNRFIIPKIGSIKYFCSRTIKGQLKRATIIKENNNWYISVLCEVEHLPMPALENQEVGLDWGVKRFFTLSNGLFAENPRFYGSYKIERKRLQKSLARKKKGSHNWKNVKRQLKRLESKIARRRKDWQHKLSTNLIRQYSGIFVENLNIKGMSKRPMPKLAEDGKTYLPNKASAKSGLNRSILDTAPNQFLEMLKYKSLWNERIFVKVDAKNTSRECSKCGHTCKENRLTQADFECILCNHKENADVNAAKNIKSRGNTTLALNVNH